MNGSADFNSRFRDVRAYLRITAPTLPPERITVTLVKSKLVFIHIYVYIILATPRHVSEASQNLVVLQIQLLLSWCDLAPHGGWNKTSSEP